MKTSIASPFRRLYGPGEDAKFHVLAPRYPAKISRMVILPVVVFMVDLLAWGPWAMKGFANEIVDLNSFQFSVYARRRLQVSFTVGRRVHDPSWVCPPAGFGPPQLPKIGNFIMVIQDRFPDYLHLSIGYKI